MNRRWPNKLDLLFLALVVVTLLTHLMPIHSGAMPATMVSGP